MPRPLDGIRVIDFGRYIAGPYCAMLLADMGADVIRVERREGGEDRYLGPLTNGGEGGLYLNLNRNKRGLTLELGRPEAQDVIRRLVLGADIVVVNLPVQVMKRLRLDYESLRSTKEDVILVMATAFGPTGPLAENLGFDGVAQAMSGSMSLTGFPDTPVRSIVSWADYGTALHAAFGAMVALYHRGQTGSGQLIDVSLLATGVTFMQPLLAERAVTGLERKQQGNAGYYSAPSDVYRTRDGWIIVPTIGTPMFRRWARLVGREDLIEAPQYADDITRADNHRAVNEVMSNWCRERTREQALEELRNARIPCGPVYSLDEVLKDPQVGARNLLEPLETPGATRPVPVAATPVRMSQTPGRVVGRAPALGEHTDQILGELGYTPEQVAALRAARVV